MTAKPEDLIGLGMPAMLAQRLGISMEDGVSATGNSSQANAYLVKAAVTNFTTVTDSSADSARLPAIGTYPGYVVFIRNSGAGTLKVYPASGEKLNALSANTAANLNAGVARIYYKVAVDKWITT